MASKETPQFNSSSMADISFLLLLYFLLTTTFDSDYGLMRQLPAIPEDETEQTPIKERNVLEVFLNFSDALMVEGEEFYVGDLKEKTKIFFTNPTNADDLPEREERTIQYLGRMVVNKQAVVSLKCDKGTSYKAYIEVQDQLAAAVNELRDELSLTHFGKKFDDLTNSDYREAIQKVYPMAISEAEPEAQGAE